jgi:hypothetical protein
MTVPLASHDQMDFGQHFSEWIVSNDRSWPYSFLNLCDALDLTADRVGAERLGAESPSFSHTRNLRN